MLAEAEPAAASPAPPPPREGARFSAGERATALALARALLPAGRVFPCADAETVDRLEELLLHFGKRAPAHYGGLLRVLEHASRPSHVGRPFSKLTPGEGAELLARWSDRGNVAERTLALALTSPLKVAYFDDPAIYAHFGAAFRFHAKAEHARWMAQVTRGEDLAEDVELECDAVVVGTGAGGAVIAKELAQRGHAVVMIEEGAYHQRDDFTGGAIENITRFYRARGTIGAVGNTVIPIPGGRLVGGSTAVNTGTCWRTPSWVLERWVRDEGLADLSPDGLAPYFERVERELDVQVADARYLGGAARVVARGCDVLGYSHYPLRRNAPGCDGSGVCDMGCPTDARRSTNVSYVPAALRSGAALYTGVRADRLLLENGRIVGLEGRAAGGRRVTVRARATVLACGTLMTPLMLQRQGLDRGLPHVGKNLSIHPATIVSALFDEEIRGYSAIPQGYCVDEFQREGILLLGASAPIDVGATQFGFVGDELMRVMEAYDRVASFGVMVEDASRGQVRPGPAGRPNVLYWLGREERERLRRGTEIVARIFLAAGAREVYPALHGHRVIRSTEGLRRLAAARPAASDWILTAFHPLGTCRIATSSRRGVISPDHEVFGLPGLFVADGSAVPSSLAVNPQVTIMALATRAADRLADRLDRAS